jgi:hypothetical protein
MQTQPSVVQTGDFLYFAPAGIAFTIPAAGVVGANAKPGAADSSWTTYALGTVKKPTADKVTAKAVEVMAPMPGTGYVVTTNVLRPTRAMKMTVEMNELSRLSLAGFYLAPFIQLTDTGFIPLSGSGSLQGWLKRQRYDAGNGLYVVDDWWVDLFATELKTDEENVLHPTFEFTWLYSALAGSAC